MWTSRLSTIGVVVTLVVTALLLTAPLSSWWGGAGGSTGELNHYSIQSRDYFNRTKIGRGSASSVKFDTVRTWDYFRNDDFHDIEDTDLRGRSDCPPHTLRARPEAPTKPDAPLGGSAGEASVAKLPAHRAEASPPARLVLVGIFKDEARNLPEWCEHYLKRQGVFHLYLIDNGSTDNWKAAIAPFLPHITVVTNATRHHQKEHYNLFLPTLKAHHVHDWVAVLDQDEFLYPTDPKHTLATVVRDVLSPGPAHQLIVPWKMFGSSRHVAQPNRVVCGFTWRRNWGTAGKLTNPKTLVRVSQLGRLNIHTPFLLAPDGSLRKPASPLVNVSEPILQALPLQLNHYPIQSRDYFNRTKIGRGSASSVKFDTVRTWDYFRNYDFHDIEDTDLRDRSDCPPHTLRARLPRANSGK